MRVPGLEQRGSEALRPLLPGAAHGFPLGRGGIGWPSANTPGLESAVGFGVK